MDREYWNGVKMALKSQRKSLEKAIREVDSKLEMIKVLEDEDDVQR